MSWTDGDITSQPLGVRPSDDDSAVGPPIRYLSQQFVDDLCAVDGISDLLRKEIERVVFNAVAPQDRLGSTSFDELMNLRLRVPACGQAELDAMDITSTEITRLRVLHDSLPSLERHRVKLVTQCEQLDRQITALTSTVDQQIAARFATVSLVLQQRNSKARWKDDESTRSTLGAAVRSACELVFRTTSAGFARESRRAAKRRPVDRLSS